MGYYTDYTLSVIEGNVNTEEVITTFEEITGYYLDPTDFYLRRKWYDWPEDMIILSKKYPNVVFQLDGSGEEDGDIWRVYFKNGKKQSANTKVEVIHEKFDESKLK